MNTSTIFIDTGITEERIHGKEKSIWHLPLSDLTESSDWQMVHVHHVPAVGRAGALYVNFQYFLTLNPSNPVSD